jgi:hypothetical protein
MSAETSSASDIIVGALRNLNVLASGETPNAEDLADALQVFNDMLESWSIEHLLVFAQTEYKFNWTPGQYQYTIGNPIVGTFTGNLTGGSNTVSNVTLPATLSTGAYLTDSSYYGGFGSIPVYKPSPSALGIGTPATTVVAMGGNSLVMSANALVTPAANDVIAYSQPGDIAYDSVTGAPMTVPLRITNAFTRITISGGNPMTQGLDYQMRIIPRDKYTALGLKGINGPWPTDLYYDRTFPLGNLYVYPNPSMAGQCHLWCDQPLLDLTNAAAPINLPSGYARALKTNLAVELAPEYGKQIHPALAQRARESKQMLKSLNSLQAVEAFFDSHVLKSRRADAGWILHGGFYT